MHDRMKYLMGATALLYIGPLMAGLGGYGWAIVPVFLAIFLLWLFILRPQIWPRDAHEWTRYPAWANLGTQAALQLLLVTMLFGIGRGIGGTVGVSLPLGEMFPIGVSFLAIPLARLFWDPRRHANLASVLDPDRHLPQSAPASADPALNTARAMIAPLAALPEESAPDLIAQHLTALAPHTNPAALRAALLERHKAKAASRAETIALILHCTDVGLIASVAGDGPTAALTHLPDDAELLALFARRLAEALPQDPEIWGKCPSTEMLAELVTKYDNTEAEAPLRDLIAATDAAQPEDGLA